MAAAKLEIRLLGEPTVLRGGEACTLPSSKKTRALLGYLVTSARSHTRERLCDLFWEGPDDPRGGLRWALSKIRPLLDDGKVCRLQADREHVAFEPNGAFVDVAEVRELARDGVARTDLERLRTAAALFRGRFLEGHDLSDCVRFYTWCVGEREELRALHVAVLSQLIERLAGAPDDALKYARGLVALDPLAEASHVKLIRLLANAGRTREALEEYQRCRKILNTQIGAKPSAELEQLRYTLTQSAASVPAPPAAVAAPAKPAPPAASTVLVGRQRELRAIERAVAAAAQPNAAALEVLLFLGDPGAGKSRLLEELCARVEALRGRVLAGRAFEAELVRPYGAWLDALRAAQPSARGELDALLGDLGEDRTGDRTLLFEALGQKLRVLADQHGPLALVVDDIQWLDESSAALLHFLARSLGGARVLIAGAARSGELGDNPAALRAVRALERQRSLVRIEVEPLDLADTAELVRRVAGGADFDAIYSESRGNPLWVLELARAGERGPSEVPETLAALIAGRLERLEGDAEVVLPWAAALGRSFDVGVLTRVTGLPATALVTALADLERHAVVRAAGPSVYDFVHDLVRRAAYDQMSDPRRRLVHAQIARALGEAVQGARASDVVYHAALAGEHALAARACIAAGQHCLRVFAYADAWELSRRGLEHAAELEPAQRLPLEEGLLALRAQRPTGEAHGELDRRLSALAREAEAAGMPEIASRAHDRQAMIRYGARDSSGARESSLRRAASGRSAGSAGVLHLLGSARCLAHVEQDMKEVAAALEEAVEIAGPDIDAVDYFWTRGLLGRFRGDYAAALADLTRTLGHSRRHARYWDVCICLNDIVLVGLESERPEVSLEHTPELIETATKVGDGALQHSAAACEALARIALDPSAAPDAWSSFELALDRIRVADGKLMLATCANFAAERLFAAARLERGRLLAAEAAVAAEAVLNTTQAALARALLVQIAIAEDDAPSALRELAALRSVEPHEISARAATAVAAARARARALTPGPDASR